MRQILSILLMISVIFVQIPSADEPTCSKLKTMRSMIESPRTVTRNQLDYDVKYYDLDLVIDPEDETVSGTVGVRFEPLTNGLMLIELDLYDGLTVSEVTDISGVNLDYSHTSNDILTVFLPVAVNVGEVYEVIVHYSGSPGSSGFGSFGFDMHLENGVYYDMIWSLSEPYGARNWWPCKDTPIDKADSVDISIRVPENLIVASNGLLVDEVNQSEWTTYHWEERYPIVTYLVSVAIYPYTIYYDWFVYGENDSMRLDYYVYDDLPYNYTLTKDMITEFSERFGLYPFIDEKYGHADFVWGGGMEHQTMTSMGGSSQYLISHELAHQWWGDMVTCANFHHIWLNEGFATYSQAMWWELRPGGSIEDLHSQMAGKSYWGGGTIYVTDTTNVGTIFNGNLSYNKASWILHMLRHIVGDEAFFAGLRAYGDQYRFQSTVTEQFRDVMEEVSGIELDAFFQRWIYGQYYPKYRSTPIWTDLGNNTSLVQVTIHQYQSSELFQMPIDIEIQTTEGSFTFVADITEQDQAFDYIVDGTPTQVSLDPDHWILRNVQNENLTPVTAFEYSTGWNLVGLPLAVSDPNYLTLFPDAIEGTLYQFENGEYVEQEHLQPGVGYWLRNTADGVLIFQGESITELTLDIAEGWNLITGISAVINVNDIDDPGEIIVPNGIFGYEGGYDSAETLEPGKAYWLRASSSGSITITINR